VYDDNAQLRGTVEIHPSERDGVCELGITVEPNLRGYGLGSRLFEAGVRWASARGYERVFIYCLRENRAMQAIARKNGMEIEYEGSDSHAYVTVEPNQVGRWNEIFEDYTSRFVYWMNRMRVR
jgi:RimJ/RimL family protein N-acetyltransferase